MKSNLREHRMKAVLNQAELAEKIGLSKSYTCQIETGKRIPKLTLAYKIAAAVNAKIEDIWPNEFANDK